MEHAGGLFGIVHKRGEERGFVARRYTAQDVQVQFHEVFLVVETPPTNPQIEPRDILDRAFGDQIGIKLGAVACTDMQNAAPDCFGVELGHLKLSSCRYCHRTLPWPHEAGG